MPLDHYVPQVHLRNFYSPALGGKKMYGIRKHDGYLFPCSSKDVCRLGDGSTNPYIEPNRIVEEFLKTIEPKYNAAVHALRSNDFGPEDIYVVVGYASYVSVATPTARRIGSDPFKHIVEQTAKILDFQGLMPEAPPEFGGKTLAELIDSEAVFAKVDPQYPQSIGISQLLDRMSIWGNCRWELIWNQFEESPFFTSDTAFAIEKTRDLRILNRVFPLTPDFAVRIQPDFGAKEFRKDLSFSRFTYKKSKPSRDEISSINKSIVQCAEHLVFFRDNQDWVHNLVKKNKDYWIVPTAQQIPVSGDGVMNIFGYRIERREDRSLDFKT